MIRPAERPEGGDVMATKEEIIAGLELTVSQGEADDGALGGG